LFVSKIDTWRLLANTARALHPPLAAHFLDFVRLLTLGRDFVRKVRYDNNSRPRVGRPPSIPVIVNSPSIKFTREVLHKIVKEKNAVNYDCNIRHTCERNDKDTNCEDAKNSEADALAPLIVSVAKYAISRGNTYLVLNVGGKSIGRVLFPKSRRN